MMKRMILFCLCLLNLVFVASCGEEDQGPQRILVNVTDGRCQMAAFDKDGDGFPDATLYIGAGCSALRTGPFDCNDNDSTVFPGAPERCNGVDNDCDGAVDEGLARCACNPRVSCDDGLFCNGSETCVATSSIASICSRTAPPCGNTATCVEATDSCASCNDNNACTDDSISAMGACVNTARVNCCNTLAPCVAGMCTSQTAMTAGICVGCISEADCGETARCDSATNSCVSCNDNNVCTTDSGAGATCTNSPIPGCCTATSQCMIGVCTSNSPMTAGMCVGCTQDTHCAGTEVCNMTSRTCVAVACVPDNDACTVETVVNRMCTRPIPAGCCRGPTDDAACTASRPTTLPMEYIWGCSTSSTAAGTPTGYRCTSCRDADRDGFCSAEICGNGLDDDGDGLRDETPCNPPGSTDAGFSDSGGAMDAGTQVDAGTSDSGVTADSGVVPDAGTVADSGVPQCTTDAQCGAGRFCAGGTCAVFVDQRGRTPYGACGANGGPEPDNTADNRDDDGDGYCEVAPCVGGSRNPSLAVASLLGGDCDDDPTDSPPGSRFTMATPQGSFQTDGSYANHPGGTEWCESPAPGYDNDCDCTPNDGC